MTRLPHSTKFPDLSADALGFDPDALALAMWRFNNPHADPAAALEPNPRKPNLNNGTRKPTLASVAKQVRKAGVAAARYEMKPDRTIVVVVGEPEPTTPENPWPLDKFRTKEIKQ
jgi:hypothetical protein